MDKGRAGRGGTERDRTNAGGERNAGRYGRQERPTGTSSIIFKFFLLSSPSHSSSLRLPLFLQSTTIGGAGLGVTDAGGTTYCSRPPREVGGATGTCSVIFCSLFSSSLLLTVLIFRLSLFS